MSNGNLSNAFPSKKIIYLLVHYVSTWRWR
jgi:hypothetical protein